MRKLLQAALLASTAISFSPAAFAQSGASEDNSAGEIIVTARRREENLEKVPIAITAISGAALSIMSRAGER